LSKGEKEGMEPAYFVIEKMAPRKTTRF